jgi:hypothetical protein
VENTTTVGCNARKKKRKEYRHIYPETNHKTDLFPLIPETRLVGYLLKKELVAALPRDIDFSTF